MFCARFCSRLPMIRHELAAASQLAAMPGKAVLAVLVLSAIIVAAGDGFSVRTVRCIGLLVVVAIASLYDLAWRIIPNWCIGVGLAVWLACSFAGIATGVESPVHLCRLIVGACAIAAVLLVVSFGADRLFGGQSIGGGDVKLLFIVALNFGWRWATAAVVASCLLGALATVATAKRRGSGEGGAFALGPWIALVCAALTLFCPI